MDNTINQSICIDTTILGISFLWLRYFENEFGSTIGTLFVSLAYIININRDI